MTAALGSLVVQVAADVARFQSDMGKIAQIAESRAKQIDNALGLVSNSLKALGAGLVIGLTVEKIRNQIDGAIAAAAGMQQLAERTGGTVEKLSGLASIAKLSGTSTDELASGLQKLAKAMVDAENGGKTTGAAFKAIGINATELKGLNPDETFLKIAKRMAEYADGTGKTAVAQALLGKSGANLLPVMKDLAEAGDLQVKVTSAQAAAADEYEKNQMRLTAAQSGMYKVIAMELVPIFNVWTLTMLDSVSASNGLKKTAADLAQDGSIAKWAIAGVNALGFLITSFEFVVRAFQSAGKTIAYIAADATAQVEALASGLSLLKGNSSLKEFLGEINRINTERLSLKDSLGSDIADIFGKQNFSDRLKARLAEYEAAKNAMATPVKRASIAYNPNEGTDTKTPGDKFVEQLQRQLEQQERGRFAMLRLEAEQKNVTEAAEPYIRKLQDIEQRNQRIARIVEQTAENQAQQGRVDSVNSSGNAMYLDLARQAEALDLTAKEQRRLTQLRALDLEVQRALVGATADTAVEVLALAEKMRNDLNSAFDALETKESSFSTGANRAFKDFAEAAGNSSKYSENMISGALQRTEDALVNFAKTGKLSFRDLFTFMADEYLRQQVRMLMSQQISGGGGLLGSLFSAAGSFFGLPSLQGSVTGATGDFARLDRATPLAAGTNYVPFDGFPATLHKGEAVVPAAYNPANGAQSNSAPSMIVNNNVQAGVTRGELMSAVQLGMQRAMQNMRAELQAKRVLT